MLTRSQFQRTLFPGVKLLVDGGLKEFPEEFSQLFNVLTSDKAFEEDLTIAGLGLFGKVYEDIEAPEDNFVKGFPKRYQHDEFALKCGASRLMKRDGLNKFWTERAPQLGRSGRQTKEILHADLFNNGFSAVTGPDGVALFSASHPNPRGGTQSNILNPVSTISVLGIRLALTSFRRFFDDTGVRRAQLMPRWLVCPPEEEYNARTILESQGVSDTSNRADNVIRNKLTVFVYDYLTDTNNWFVLSDKGSHQLKSYTREAFNTKEYMTDDPEIQYVLARMAFSFGHSHWIGTLGSNPP